MENIKKYKQNNNKRKRPHSLGLKLSAQEVEALNLACQELGLTKVEFLLAAVRNYKEVAKYS